MTLVQICAMTEPAPGAMSKRAARGRATREQLIGVATRLFAQHGYEDTSIEDVLAEAGVSRGALYHHFAGKDALFEAVVGNVESRVMADLAVAAEGIPDAAGRLRAVALAWIGMAVDPVIQRVMLLDAPSVLGVEYWLDPDQQQALTAMKELLREVSGEGRLAPDMIAPFASMILGALDEMALAVARAPDPEAALPGARTAVGELLRRVLTP
jgi:AcrR family transcriptional regulator